MREPVAVAGPGFPDVCVLFAYAEFHVVCVFERSAHFSTEVAYRIALLLFHFASPLSRRLHQHCLLLPVIKMSGRHFSRAGLRDSTTPTKMQPELQSSNNLLLR